MAFPNEKIPNQLTHLLLKKEKELSVHFTGKCFPFLMPGRRLKLREREVVGCPH